MPISQNGWSAFKDSSGRLDYSAVPGTNVRIGVRKGDVSDVLKHVAAEFNKRVEKISGGVHDDWGYNYRVIRGGGRLSNHSSGTAIDLNSVQHPLGTNPHRNFSAQQISEIHQILREVHHLVRWGGDYNGRKDGMHFEINGSHTEISNLAKHITNHPSKPEKPHVKPIVSLAVLQVAMKQGKLATGIGGNDGKQLQRALNRALGIHLLCDGVLGKRTRAAMAHYQAKRFNVKLGSSDADGIPGKESLAALGFDVR